MNAKNKLFLQKKKSISNIQANEKVFSFLPTTKIKRPLLGHTLVAGFPSPAQDYIEDNLDLNKYLINHISATFFVKVSGDSMIGAGIHDSDMLIVDRALEPHNNNVIVAILDGDLTVKRLITDEPLWYLKAENPLYPPIYLNKESDFSVWGVVTFVIHSL